MYAANLCDRPMCCVWRIVQHYITPNAPNGTNSSNMYPHTLPAGAYNTNELLAWLEDVGAPKRRRVLIAGTGGTSCATTIVANALLQHAAFRASMSLEEHTAGTLVGDTAFLVSRLYCTIATTPEYAARALKVATCVTDPLVVVSTEVKDPPAKAATDVSNPLPPSKRRAAALAAKQAADFATPLIISKEPIPTALWLVVDCSQGGVPNAEVTFLRQILGYVPFPHQSIAVLFYRPRWELMVADRVTFLLRQKALFETFTPLKDVIVDVIDDNDGELALQAFLSREHCRTRMLMLHARLLALADACTFSSTSHRLRSPFDTPDDNNNKGDESPADGTSPRSVDKPFVSISDFQSTSEAQRNLEADMMGAALPDSDPSARKRLALLLRQRLAVLTMKTETFFAATRARDPLCPGSAVVRIAAVAMSSIRSVSTLSPVLSIFRCGVVAEELRRDMGMQSGSTGDLMKGLFWSCVSSPYGASVCFAIIGQLYGAAGLRFSSNTLQGDELVGQDAFGIACRVFYMSLPVPNSSASVTSLYAHQGQGTSHYLVRAFCRRLFVLLFKIADAYRMSFVAQQTLCRKDIAAEFNKANLHYVLPPSRVPMVTTRSPGEAKLLPSVWKLHSPGGVSLETQLEAAAVGKLLEACYIIPSASPREEQLQRLVEFSEAQKEEGTWPSVDMCSSRPIVIVEGGLAVFSTDGKTLYIACRGTKTLLGDSPLSVQYARQQLLAKVNEMLSMSAAVNRIVVGGHEAGCMSATAVALPAVVKAISRPTIAAHLFGAHDMNGFFSLLKNNVDAHFHTATSEVTAANLSAYPITQRVHFYQDKHVRVGHRNAMGRQMMRAFLERDVAKDTREWCDIEEASAAQYNFAALAMQESELRESVVSGPGKQEPSPGSAAFVVPRAFAADAAVPPEVPPRAGGERDVPQTTSCRVLPIIARLHAPQESPESPFVFLEAKWAELRSFWQDGRPDDFKPCVVYVRGDRSAKRRYLRRLFFQLDMSIPPLESSLHPLGVWAYLPPLAQPGAAKSNLVVLESSEITSLDVFCMQVASVVRTVVSDDIVPEDTYPLLHSLHLAATCRLCITRDNRVECLDQLKHNAECVRVAHINTMCHGAMVQACASNMMPSIVTLAATQSYTVSERSLAEGTFPIFSADSAFLQRHLSLHYMPRDTYCVYFYGALAAVTSHVERQIEVGLQLVGHSALERTSSAFYNVIDAFERFADSSKVLRAQLEDWKTRTLKPLSDNIDSTLREYCAGFIKLAELAEMMRAETSAYFFCEVLSSLTEAIEGDDVHKPASWGCQWIEEFRRSSFLFGPWLGALEASNRFAWNFASSIIECREEYAFWLFSELKMCRDEADGKWVHKHQPSLGEDAPFIRILLRAVERHSDHTKPMPMHKSTEVRDAAKPGEAVARCCGVALRRYEGFARLTSHALWEQRNRVSANKASSDWEGVLPSGILRGLGLHRLTIHHERTLTNAGARAIAAAEAVNGRSEPRTAHGKAPRAGETVDLMRQLSSQCGAQSHNIFVSGCFRAVCTLLRCSLHALLQAPSLANPAATIETELTEACKARIEAQALWMMSDYCPCDPHANGAAGVLAHLLPVPAKKKIGAEILPDVIRMIEVGVGKLQSGSADTGSSRMDLVRGVSILLSLYRSIGLDEGVEQIFIRSVSASFLKELPARAATLITAGLQVIREATDTSDKDDMYEAMEHLLAFLLAVQGKVTPEQFRAMRWDALEQIVCDIAFDLDDSAALAAWAFALAENLDRMMRYRLKLGHSNVNFSDEDAMCCHLGSVTRLLKRGLADDLDNCPLPTICPGRQLSKFQGALIRHYLMADG